MLLQRRERRREKKDIVNPTRQRQLSEDESETENNTGDVADSDKKPGGKTDTGKGKGKGKGKATGLAAGLALMHGFSAANIGVGRLTVGSYIAFSCILVVTTEYCWIAQTVIRCLPEGKSFYENADRSETECVSTLHE